jgi:hypothetical protein
MAMMLSQPVPSPPLNAMDSGTRITIGGSGYAALLARKELCTVRNSAR